MGFLAKRHEGAAGWILELPHPAKAKEGFGRYSSKPETKNSLRLHLQYLWCSLARGHFTLPPDQNRERGLRIECLQADKSIGAVFGRS